MNTTKLQIWCDAHGIDPKVLDHVDVKDADGDPVDTLRAILKNAKPATGQTMDRIGPKEQLEFLGIIRGE